jgi:adenosylcobinamide-phosphate synthase
LSEFVVRYWQHKSKAHHEPVSESLQAIATQAWRLIDWLPARMSAISFAVVGSFEEAIDGWRNYSPRFPGDNDGIILAATSGAVNIRLGAEIGAEDVVKQERPEAVTAGLESVNLSSPGQTPDLAHLAVIVGLVWRTVVMWMVLLALLTLARLLG